MVTVIMMGGYLMQNGVFELGSLGAPVYSITDPGPITSHLDYYCYLNMLLPHVPSPTLQPGGPLKMSDPPQLKPSHGCHLAPSQSLAVVSCSGHICYYSPLCSLQPSPRPSPQPQPPASPQTCRPSYHPQLPHLLLSSARKCTCPRCSSGWSPSPLQVAVIPHWSRLPLPLI